MIALLEFHDRAYRGGGGGGGRAQNAEAMSMGCMMFTDKWAGVHWQLDISRGRNRYTQRRLR